MSTGGNVTETEEQNNEERSLQGGKSITVEEVPSKSTDFQIEEPTEGNVTIKGQLANNTIQDSSITTSSELQDEDQQQQQPLEEEATGTQDENQQQQQPLEEEATGTQDEDQQQQQPLEEEATGTR